jgi:hypothetical protein
MTRCTHGWTQGIATDGQWHGEGPRPPAGHVLCLNCGEMVSDPHAPAAALAASECIEYGDTCRGEVHYRTPLSGTGKSFARCEHHWSQRLDTWERMNREYPDSPIAPAWFDETAAGEHWDSDY